MALNSEYRLRLEPNDEFPHAPDGSANYNESMYFNIFDPDLRMGGWFRLGNRPNEGYAEMTVCLYLSDGRVAFAYARPKIANNKKMEAGGMKIAVIEPFKRLHVSYSGKVVVLAQPFDMADPSRAFRDNPNLDCNVELDYEGISPMYGGETIRSDGAPIAIDPEKSFAKAHYEQHMAAIGSFRIGEQTFSVSGFGLRDKSWGPRYWQAIHWYRWCPMNFGRDFGMMLSVVAGTDGRPREGGMVFKDGKYDLITQCHIDSEWDSNWYQTGLTADITTQSGATYHVTGKVISLIPLRNRRKTPDGQELVTRITEGMTEYKCGGRLGYGLSEYLDQIVDGKPVSVAS